MARQSGKNKHDEPTNIAPTDGPDEVVSTSSGSGDESLVLRGGKG
jgi:hypothetical protein